ncbi:MAG: hypothetical protein OHK0029_33120 [Armatimonadaceae bacterium]
MAQTEPTFSLSSDRVDVYDFAEITICLHTAVEDPFQAVEVLGKFNETEVSGFCDSQDGNIHRIRFMPTEAGEYSYSVTMRYGETEATHEGKLTAHDAGHRGMLRVDEAHPFHLIWSGTGEHFFWNGTTCYMMAGLSEERMETALERLSNLGINRVRVALCPSRQKDGGRWFEEAVQPREDFTFCYSPWLCARPESLTDPGWDTTRFDVAFWQKYERLLTKARSLGIIVQVIFVMDAQEDQNYPFDREKTGDDANEHRYYRYGIARLGAFSNVEWCLTNEWHLFRPDEWADAIGAFVEEIDPYDHLTSVHGTGRFPFSTSPWADVALFQSWDESGGYDFMLKKRQEQAASGRPIPQINEEYGYEDHYPTGWGGARVAPARSADNRRRLAWEITMAGAYQTTGESAANGVGGWINGLGDETMTMLHGYRYAKAFFESFPWWKLEPIAGEQRASLPVPEDAKVLHGDGVATVVYLPQGGTVGAAVAAAMPEAVARWYNPRNGEWHNITANGGEEFVSPTTGEDDWALLITAPRQDDAAA